MAKERTKKLLLLLILIKKREILRRKRRETYFRRYWVHPLNRRRLQSGIYDNLIKEMRLYNARHTRYLRMNVASFDFILNLVRPLLTKTDTRLRKAIPPGLKLALTLHYLAEGVSHSCIADHYRLGRSTVSNIIYDTCDALWSTLQPLFLQPPTGPTEWKAVAEGWVIIIN